MKDEVFSKAKGAVSFNTAALERILKKEFTETRCMDDESYPRSVLHRIGSHSCMREREGERESIKRIETSLLRCLSEIVLFSGF